MESALAAAPTPAAVSRNDRVVVDRAMVFLPIGTRNNATQCIGPDEPRQLRSYLAFRLEVDPFGECTRAQSLFHQSRVWNAIRRVTW